MGDAPIDNTANLNVSRRGVLLNAALFGAASIAAGCAGRTKPNFPGPVWPDEEPPPVTTIGRQPVYQAPQPRVIAQQPQPMKGAMPQVGVNPRSTWTNGQPKMHLSKPMNGVQLITVHHDALNSAGKGGRAFAIDRLTRVRREHLSRDASWVDIGYHFIIDPDGSVWEGRPLSIEGAHVARTNDHNMGIMLMGNFDEHRPTTAQINTLEAFLAQQMMTHRVGITNLYTHQELKSTACPGRSLQAHMRSTRGSKGRLRSVIG
jgi:hypothetical protein